LCGHRVAHEDRGVSRWLRREPAIEREDVVSIMRGLIYIRADVARILEILEPDDGEEEEETAIG
jgi:hypothetical protein